MAHAWLAMGDRALRKAVSVWIYPFYQSWSSSSSFLLHGYICALWRVSGDMIGPGGHSYSVTAAEGEFLGYQGVSGGEVRCQRGGFRSFVFHGDSQYVYDAVSVLFGLLRT